MNKKLTLTLSAVLCLCIPLMGCKAKKDFYNKNKDAAFELLAIEDASFEVPTLVMQNPDAEYAIKAHWISIKAPEYEIYACQIYEDLATKQLAESKQTIEEQLSDAGVRIGEGRKTTKGEGLKAVFECEADGLEGSLAYWSNSEKSFCIYAVTDGQIITADQCLYTIKSLEHVENNESTCAIGKYAELDKDAWRIKNASKSTPLNSLTEDNIEYFKYLMRKTVGNENFGYMQIPNYFQDVTLDSSRLVYESERGAQYIITKLSSDKNYKDVYKAWQNTAGESNVEYYNSECDYELGQNIKFTEWIRVQTSDETVIIGVCLLYTDEKRVIEYHCPSKEINENEAECLETYKPTLVI